MPSQGFNQVLEILKAMPDNAGASIEERRKAMETEVTLLPVADGVTSEPLKIGELQAEWIIPVDIDSDVVILYLHGGGYCVGSISTHRSMVTFLAKSCKAKVLIINYRLAPENPFPAAIEDAVAAYRWLQSEGISPQQTIIAGDSAGGGLTVATMLDLKQKGDTLPAAAICISPWTDLELTGDSMESKADVDPILKKDELKKTAKAYLSNTNPRNPLASPIYADLKGLPPMLIQVGTNETLLDDSLRLAENAKAAGVDTTLECWDDMIHVWQIFVGMAVSESQDAVNRIAEFIKKYSW